MMTGNVHSATWKESMNTPIVIADTDNIRLRIKITYYNPDSSHISLRCTEDAFNWRVYGYNHNGSIINELDTGKFFISPSNYLSDQHCLFDNQLLSQDQTYIYRKTITFDSTNNYFLNGNSNSVYELEYSLKPTSKLEPGSAYFFTLFDDSIPMSNSYGDNEYPVILTPPINWTSQSFYDEYPGVSFDGYFIDPNIGFLIGYGCVNSVSEDCNIILKTTDGGSTWKRQSCPTNVSYIRKVCFINSNVGTIAGESGLILRTTNGGNNWIEQHSNTTCCPKDVCFINENKGIIVGVDWQTDPSHNIGVILKTTDGGKTWSSKTYPNNVLSAVHFTNENTGIIVGSDGIILRTTDGGDSWITQSSGLADFLNDVSFFDENYGIAVGSGYGYGDLSPVRGIMLRTTDGGTHWSKSTDISGPILISLCFVNQNTGWAAGDYGKILKTTDGGLTWKKLTTGTCQSFQAIHFVNSDIGWALGYNKIWKTTNGGITVDVKEKQKNNIPINFYLSQNYPNPFNPSTTIKYSIPVVETGHTSSRQFVQLKVYDLLGREITTLVDEEKPVGSYEIKWNAAKLTSGVYFYQLKAGNYTATKKLLLLK